MPRDDVFSRYFRDRVEYPDVTAVMMAPGIRQDYVSNTFLDGWINYVTPVSVWLMTRYRKHEENVAALAEWAAAPKYHTKLGDFGDDVLVLAREGAGTRQNDGTWWLFHYDCDVSDCSIGRFDTYDAVLVVVSAFDSMVAELGREVSVAYGADRAQDPQAIDVKNLRGWLSW